MTVGEIVFVQSTDGSVWCSYGVQGIQICAEGVGRGFELCCVVLMWSDSIVDSDGRDEIIATSGLTNTKEGVQEDRTGGRVGR